ncbi:MAG: tryptophan synthase subunit alpha [Actinobacteria bacterium]|nr:MAG: tryptophan synthase subunit alpha [Actinomycetota bacterium]
MSLLSETFATTRAEGRAALVGYLPAGFPSAAEAVAVIAAMVENGVDIVEVGLPYSDPLMDGPVIQSAVDTALAGGTRIRDVFACVAATAASGAPALVMSYWNPIERYGTVRFADELAAAGGVGVITPDLTPEEAGEWIAATDAARLDRVFLVAPSSTDERIQTVAGVTTGFVYAASTMGVTGVRTAVSGAAEQLVARVRAATTLPVCVGLGVSTGAQAAEVAGYADGVIVGSAFVRAVQSADSPAAARAAVGRLSRELAAGVRG